MIRRVAVIRLSAFGDIIHTIPAVYTMKYLHPDLEFSWFVDENYKKILAVFTPFAEIIALRLKGQTLKQGYRELRRIKENYHGKFDGIIDFQGLIKSALLSFALGGKRYGFHKKNLRETPAKLFYTEQSAELDEFKTHIVYKNLQLANKMLSDANLNPIDSQALQYPERNSKTASTELSDFFSTYGFEPQQYVLLNIGGGWESKLLTDKQNMRLLSLLKSDYPLIILWGNDREKIRAKSLSHQSGIPMAPFLKFDDLFHIIDNAKALISGDSLPLHIADLVQTRSIGIFGPTAPERNGSLQERSISIYHKSDCSPCYKRDCSDMQCIYRIEPSEIRFALNQIVAN